MLCMGSIRPELDSGYDKHFPVGVVVILSGCGYKMNYVVTFSEQEDCVWVWLVIIIGSNTTLQYMHCKLGNFLCIRYFMDHR